MMMFLEDVSEQRNDNQDERENDMKIDDSLFSFHIACGLPAPLVPGVSVVHRRNAREKLGTHTSVCPW